MDNDALAEKILRTLYEIWCKDHGMVLTKFEISKKECAK